MSSLNSERLVLFQRNFLSKYVTSGSCEVVAVHEILKQLAQRCGFVSMQ